MSQHYDVVVLGAGLGPLCAAALLARRAWRVLVLGHGWRPPTYAYDGISLARRPFTFLAHSSPVCARALAELAQTQLVRRRLVFLDPMFQVLGPGVRLDVPSDPVRFAREVAREYPDARRSIDALYRALAHINALADAAFDKDAVWPPAGFWERRETERLASLLPGLLTGRDPLAAFPSDHPFRAAASLPVAFSTHLAGPLSPFAMARLHGAWTRGTAALARGEDALVELLVERIRTHGGEVRLGEAAERIVERRGRVACVGIAGDPMPAGADFVVSDLPTPTLLSLVDGFAPRRAPPAARVEPAERRFVLSAVVGERGLAPSLGTEAFLLPERGGGAGGALSVHLQRSPGVCGPPGTVLLTAEALLAADGEFPLGQVREALLAKLERFLPFVERHYVLVDSPHDGRPLWDYRGGTRREVDRTALRLSGGAVAPEPMVPRWRVDGPSWYGLGAESLRTPLVGALVAGPTVLPSLGQEGELMAAWGVARVITRTDRRRERMRRKLWTRIEIG